MQHVGAEVCGICPVNPSVPSNFSQHGTENCSVCQLTWFALCVSSAHRHRHRLPDYFKIHKPQIKWLISMATMASFKKLQNDTSAAGDTFDQAVAQAAFADPMSQAGFDNRVSIDANEIAASSIDELRSGNGAGDGLPGILPAAVALVGATQGASNQGAIAQDGTAIVQGIADSTISRGGITFHLMYDAAAMAAPESFRAGVEQAAFLLAGAITDRITVNLTIDYSGLGEGAHAGALGGTFESYSVVRAAMINHGVANPDILGTLSIGSSIQGQPSVDV